MNGKKKEWLDGWMNEWIYTWMFEADMVGIKWMNGRFQMKKKDNKWKCTDGRKVEWTKL